ncbi:hypothetical protein OKW27_007090 [Paraburkholderia sp. 35.1]
MKKPALRGLFGIRSQRGSVLINGHNRHLLSIVKFYGDQPSVKELQMPVVSRPGRAASFTPCLLPANYCRWTVGQRRH